jgi:hypothetical protein
MLCLFSLLLLLQLSLIKALKIVYLPQIYPPCSNYCLCGKENVVGEDLDIAEDNNRVIQGVVTMHAYEKETKGTCF